MSPEAIAAVNTVSYEQEGLRALRRALVAADKRIEALVAENRSRIDLLAQKDDEIAKLKEEVSQFRKDLHEAHRRLARRGLS